MSENDIKYEAYQVSFSIMKDTGGPSASTSRMSVLMDTNIASADRAIDEVKKHLIKQGHLPKTGDPVDVVSARRLKVFEVTKQADLGDIIIIN